jgi:hypothetical protein
MTATNSALGAVLYENESTFGEDIDTTATRLQTLGPVDLSGFTQEKQNIDPTRQRPHEGVQDERMTMGGSFSVRLLLTGHGGTAATTLTATNLYTLLKNVIGSGSVTNVGTTCTGGTASIPTLTAGTVADGSVIKFGVLGDGDGEGQFYAVDNLTGANLTLLTDLGATPAAADVVYAAQMVYPSETPGTIESVTSTRWRLMTGNKQILAHGCYPTAVEFSNLNAGELPQVTVSFSCAWWEIDNETFPDATATAAKTGAPVAAGSFWMNAVGTSTNATYGLRNGGLRIEFTTIPLVGPGGSNSYQHIVGARRVRCQAFLSTTFDAEASGTTTWDDLYTTAEGSAVNRHAVWTLSVADGRALGLYFPNLKIITPRPTQQDVDGLNRVQVEWEALTSADTTSDLTLANFILAMA